MYVAVSRTDDLYVVQSSRPVRVILNLSEKTAGYLRGIARGSAPGKGRPPLPFKPAEIILALDPYFPQAASEPLAPVIQQLAGLGYRQYMVNNPGHFSLFRSLRPDVQLIAGPWLYMFNSWALSFVASLGADAFVSPLENNRQNLERTFGTDSRNPLRAMAFIPVFALPPLFRIRADLRPAYGFRTFSDNLDENFTLVTGPEGSTVIPEKPFSITDKIPFLKEAGFRRFIIDLSGPPLKKRDYKDLMRAVDTGAPLPRVSRFNWKDGFQKNE